MHLEVIEMIAPMPIVCCMEELASSHASEWNAESRSDANSFLLAISHFFFVVALV